MKNQKGQVLLIVVMLLATALTVALSVSFTSQTETKLTKLEEESQKALAAAEAGIEAALKEKQSVTLGAGSLSDIKGFTGGATVSKVEDKPTFVSPLVLRNEQYTFYLADYPGFTNNWSGNLDIYFKTETNCPSLELTFIDNNNLVTRALIDPDACGNQITKNPGSDIAATGGNYTIDGVNFGYKTSFSTPVANKKLLIVRVLFASTKIGFQGTSNLRSQGQYVNSTAQSNTGVTKKVQLFQSNPQIPSEFFITSF